MTEEMKKDYANINATYGAQALTKEQLYMVGVDALIKAKRKEREDTISRKHLLSEIDDLMQSPWFNRYKDDIGVLRHGYIERKEAVEVVRDLCIKSEPYVTPKQRWIPLTWDESKCESSYPDDMDGCWAIFTDGKNMSIERGKKDAIDHFFPSGRWFEMSEAIAWMPLPEPYKEGE